MEDYFQDFPRPTMRSYSFSTHSNSSSTNNKNADLAFSDISTPEMLQFIQSSTRKPEEFGDDAFVDEEGLGSAVMFGDENGNSNDEYADGQESWHKFIASFGLLSLTRGQSDNFQRELRHLDSAHAREVHKVAVIYVAKDQQVKSLAIVFTKNILI